MEPIVNLRHVTKTYDHCQAVRDLTLQIHPGEIFAFLGPNGSGKTTTFLMMLGLTAPTAGEITVCGASPVKDSISVKRQVSYLPDTLGFYEDLTASENLLYMGALSGLSPAQAEDAKEALLKRVDLYDVRNKKVGKFSRGMKQRLGIADVLMNDPKMIILDEPTLGLDPDGAQELLGIIKSLSEEKGITVLLSSHQLEHVQLLGGRIAIFRKGEMKACGTIASIAKSIRKNDNEQGHLVLANPEGFAEFAAKSEYILTAKPKKDGFLVTCKPGYWEAFLREVIAKGFVAVRITRPNDRLSQVYSYFFHEQDVATA